jgi:hypothetical protein
LGKIYFLISIINFKAKFSELVIKAKGSKPVIVKVPVLNEAQQQSILNTSMSSLDQNFQDCENKSITDKRAVCYNIMANFIRRELKQKLGGSWMVSVGQYLKCMMESDYQTYMEFYIGDIEFDVEKIA